MRPLLGRFAGAIAGAVLAAPCAGSFAASQLFKCVDGGRVVYQQQACPVSSQPDGAASAARIGAKASAPMADASTAAPRKLRRRLRLLQPCPPGPEEDEHARQQDRAPDDLVEVLLDPGDVAEEVAREGDRSRPRARRRSRRRG